MAKVWKVSTISIGGELQVSDCERLVTHSEDPSYRLRCEIEKRLWMVWSHTMEI